MRRRDFVRILSGTALWPLAAHAQQAEKIPVVALIRDGSPDTSTRFVAAFRKGLDETGYVEGQNVIVEYHWLEGSIRSAANDIGRTGSPRGSGHCHARWYAFASRRKLATATIPIIFGVGDDPVRLWSCRQSRPAPVATRPASQFFHPGGERKAAAAPARAGAQGRSYCRAGQSAQRICRRGRGAEYNAAPSMGLQIQILNASTIDEIDAAFATFARERSDALFVAGDALFVSRHGQLATLTARDRSGGLWDPRICRSWRLDELRNRHLRYVPPSRARIVVRFSRAPNPRKRR